ncbi:MAG: QueT transporter family protein [Clostridia bacterium]|nr:QueT transporter family protein [Clostridia bacterium]
MKMNHTARYITRAAVIAAVYALLTRLIWAFGSGAIQLRISEAMCVLPLIFPEAVPGLFVGCLVANIIGGGHILDIIFGSLATLLAAYLTMKTGYKLPEVKSPKYWLAVSFPVICNMLITGTVVWYAYGFSGFGISESHAWNFLPVTMLTVGAGELISVFVLGTLLYCALKKMPKDILE